MQGTPRGDSVLSRRRSRDPFSKRCFITDFIPLKTFYTDERNI